MHNMDHKLLNLAEAAGMQYTGARFIFTYKQLQKFYNLVVKEYEKAGKDDKVL